MIVQYGLFSVTVINHNERERNFVITRSNSDNIPFRVFFEFTHHMNTAFISFDRHLLGLVKIDVGTGISSTRDDNANGNCDDNDDYDM